MLAICGLATLAIFGQSSSTIDVHHVRPSAMIESLRQLVPSGTTLTADDGHSQIVVKGDKAATESLVAMFDVVARKLIVTVTIDSPIDHAHCEFQGSAATNRETKFSDASTGVELTVVPRINGDGTITYHLVASYRGAAKDLVVREANGAACTLDFRKGLDETLLAPPSISVSGKIAN